MSRDKGTSEVAARSTPCSFVARACFYEEQLQAEKRRAATTSSNQRCHDVQAKTDTVRGGY